MNELESIKRKLRRPLPMRGFEIKLYFSVFAPLLFGLISSIFWKDWQYFERSGSLVIVVAIILAWYDHVNKLGDMERFYKVQFSYLLAEMERSRPKGIIAGAMHDGKREQMIEVSSNLENLCAMLKLRLRTTEAIVLCIGTLVWGYGSIVGNIFWHFEK